MMEFIKNRLVIYLLMIIAALLITLAGAGKLAFHYKGLHEQTEKTLKLTHSLIESQNEQAEDLLKQRTAERDEKQRKLNELAKEQETKDAAATAEIERLATELSNRPIRVRYVTSPADNRESGGDSNGNIAGDTGDSGENANASYGLLPESNSRRLGEAVKEVEQLSAAFNSCKQTLMSDRRIAFNDTSTIRF